MELVPALAPLQSEDTPRPAAPRIPYHPALDGLRALCVVAILLYHAELPWLPGGFLGVEVFFVISGYLITALLRAELEGSGRIELLAFWQRRARRLLPALWALLWAVSVYAALFLREELWRLRGEVLAGLTYVSNWYLALSERSYFENVGRPSLLRHLWSLAIEEQFYLAWPLLFAACFRRWSARATGWLTLLLAGCSGAWMAARFVPATDPSPLYFDSGARAAAMLLGATLACWWTPAAHAARRAVWLDFLGMAGLASLVFACVRLSEADAFVFRGGLLVLDLATLAVIGAVVHPGAHLLKRALSREPLRWLGTRSYGLYLWHWPLFALTRPGLDLAWGELSVLALRLAASLVIAELSYRFIEEPVRSGRLSRGLRARWSALKQRTQRTPALGLASCATLCSVGLAFATHALVAAEPPPQPSYDLTPVSAVASSLAPLASSSAASPAPTGENALPVATAPSRVLVFGDSVVQGAARYLRDVAGAEVEIDSEIGRTASTGLPRLRKLKRLEKLPATVIVHVGNNGWLYEEQVHEMMALFERVERVVFINARVPRRWQDRNNRALATVLTQYPRAILIDWARASEGHREWFGADGLHLTHAGAAAFAALITPHVVQKP